MIDHFLTLKIRFQIWQYKRSLTAKLRLQRRKELENAKRWQNLEHDQNRVDAKLKGNQLSECIAVYFEYQDTIEQLTAITRKQIAMTDTFLENLTKQPRPSRRELLEAQDLIHQILEVHHARA
jgi:hypothetical protein